MLTTSESGTAGLASEKGKDAAEGEKRDNDGGGDEKRRRSRPWKAGGREIAESRAEARDEACSDGLRIEDDKKDEMSDLPMAVDDVAWLSARPRHLWADRAPRTAPVVYVAVS